MLSGDHDTTRRRGTDSLGVFAKLLGVRHHKEVHSLMGVSRYSVEWADTAGWGGTKESSRMTAVKRNLEKALWGYLILLGRCVPHISGHGREA